MIRIGLVHAINRRAPSKIKGSEPSASILIARITGKPTLACHSSSDTASTRTSFPSLRIEANFPQPDSPGWSGSEKATRPFLLQTARKEGTNHEYSDALA